ncbi:hypothetical protein ACUTFU_23425 [Enterobacter hormaechei]
MNKTKGCLIANFATVPNQDSAPQRVAEAARQRSPATAPQAGFQRAFRQ